MRWFAILLLAGLAGVVLIPPVLADQNITVANVTTNLYTTSPINWVKPTGCSFVEVIAYGGGGGGGGGSGGAVGTYRQSGSGGGGGARNKYLLYCSDVSSTVAVTIGAAGTLGAGAPAAGTGSNGGVGGTSSFGTYVYAYGGGGGAGGANANGAAYGGSGGGSISAGATCVAACAGGAPQPSPATVGVYGIATGGAGISGSGDVGLYAEYGGASGGGGRTTAGRNGGTSMFGGAAGASGGGVSYTNVEAVAGAGGAAFVWASSGGGGTAGAVNGGAGGAGATGNSIYGGSGGGGGGGQASGTGGAGNTGGAYGGGGGGGGAGTTVGGAGAAGGKGAVIVNAISSVTITISAGSGGISEAQLNETLLDYVTWADLNATLEEYLTEETFNATMAGMNVTINQINVTVNLINATVNDIQDAIFQINTTIEGMEADVDAIEITVTQINDTVNQLNVSLTLINATVEDIQSTVDDIETAISNMQLDIDGLTTSIGQINDTLISMNVTINGILVQVTASAATIDAINNTVNQINQTVNDIIDRLDAMNLTEQQMILTLAQIVGGITDMNTTLNNVSAVLSTVVTSLDELNLTVNAQNVILNTILLDLADMNSTILATYNLLLSMNSTIGDQLDELNLTLNSHTLLLNQIINDIAALNITGGGGGSQAVYWDWDNMFGTKVGDSTHVCAYTIYPEVSCTLTFGGVNFTNNTGQIDFCWDIDGLSPGNYTAQVTCNTTESIPSWVIMKQPSNITTFCPNGMVGELANTTFTAWVSYTMDNGTPISTATATISFNGTVYNLTYNATTGHYEGQFNSSTTETFDTMMYISDSDSESQQAACTISFGTGIPLTVRLWQQIGKKVTANGTTWAIVEDNYNKQLIDPYINDFAVIVAKSTTLNASGQYNYCNVPLGVGQGALSFLNYGNWMPDALKTTLKKSFGDTIGCDDYWMHADYYNGIAVVWLPAWDTYDIYLIEDVMSWENDFAPPKITKSNMFMALGGVPITSDAPQTIDFSVPNQELDFWSSMSDSLFWFMIGVVPILIFIALSLIGLPIQLVGLITILWEIGWIVNAIF